MKKKYDIVAMGESLIDFLVADKAGDILRLEGNPGGAPANVLAAASRLGMQTAFLGKIGRDAFGDYIRRSIESVGIDVTGMVSGEEPTTIAVVDLDARGNRSFRFYRNRTSDIEFRKEELDTGYIAAGRVFHFGSVSMTDNPSREATLFAARFARENGVAVSYDPNYRAMLWKDEDEARRVMLEGLSYANIAKVAHEELEFLTGSNDVETEGKKLVEQYGLDLLAVTLGTYGCVLFCNGYSVYGLAYDVESIDTTGAGDASWGACLYRIMASERPLAEYGEDDLKELANYLNAAGSLATTKHGAIPAMPTLAEIENCIATVPFYEKKADAAN